jgi:hypothetical protein
MSLDNSNFNGEEGKGANEELDRSLLEIISEKKISDKESISSSKQLDEISQTLTLEVKPEVKKKTVEQFCEMLESDLFVDYFNKYLSLPIFGQVAFYDMSECRFRVYPDVSSAYWIFDENKVIDWLYHYRFLRFNTSILSTEYILCKNLCEATYFKNNDSTVEEALQFLQNKFLRGVSKMKNFRQFLQALPSSTTKVVVPGDENNVCASGDSFKYSTGYIIYNFWLDAQRFQATIESNSSVWYQLMVEIRDKYSHHRSSLQLPKHLLEHESLACWDSQAIVTASKIFLTHLRYYWVPRYLLSIKEDGIKGTEIALFSLAKKHLHVTQPNYYPHILRPENVKEETEKKPSRAEKSERETSKESVSHIDPRASKEFRRKSRKRKSKKGTSQMLQFDESAKEQKESKADVDPNKSTELAGNSIKRLSTRRLSVSLAGSFKLEDVKNGQNSDCKINESPRDSNTSHPTSSRRGSVARTESQNKEDSNWRKVKRTVRVSKTVTINPVYIRTSGDDGEIDTDEDQLNFARMSSMRLPNISEDAEPEEAVRKKRPSGNGFLSATQVDQNNRRKSIIVDDQTKLYDYSTEESDEESTLDDSSKLSNSDDWSFGSDSNFTSLLGSLVDSQEELEQNGKSDRRSSRQSQSSDRRRSSSINPTPRQSAVEKNKAEKRHSTHKRPSHITSNGSISLVVPEINLSGPGGAPSKARRSRVSQSSPASSVHSGQSGQAHSVTGSLAIPGSRTSLGSTNSHALHGRRRSIMKYHVNDGFGAITEENEEDDGKSLASKRSHRYKSSKRGSFVGSDVSGEGNRNSFTMPEVSHSNKNSRFSTAAAGVRGKVTKNAPATVPIEQYLRSYISTVGVLDRAALQKSAMATNQQSLNRQQRVEIMKSSVSVVKANKSSVKVKSSRHTKSQMSAAKFSKMSVASNLSGFTDEESDELQPEDSAFNGVGSTKKKKKRVRSEKQQTFAFSLGDMMKNSAPPGDNDTDDSGNVSNPSTKNSDKSKNTPDSDKNQKRTSKNGRNADEKAAGGGGMIMMELGKEASNRAQKAEQLNNRLKWERQQQEIKRRASQDKRESLKRKSFDKQKMNKRKSTVSGIDDVSMQQMKQFQEKMIENGAGVTQDKEWRDEQQVVIQALQSDEMAAFPFRQWLFEEEAFTQLQILGVWIDIERLRSQTQLGSELKSHEQYKSFFKKLVSRCIHDNTSQVPNYISPVIKDMLLKIDPSTIFDIPKAFIQLQRDLFDEIIMFFREYCKVETKRFKEWACEERPRRRVTFGTDIDYCSSEEDEFEASNYHPQLKNRMSRAVALALDITQIHKYQKLSKRGLSGPKKQNDSSDENGEVPVKTVEPIYWNVKPKMTVEYMYEHVKHEYPAAGYKGHTQNTDFENDFKRPLRKNGNLIHRPTVRPKSLKEILKNAIHYEFFRRYLRCRKVDKMLVFWRSIEQMKNTHNTKQRQLKAQHIMEKFFHDPEKSACELLCCNAPIIHEIPGLEVVTTSMLFSAQNTILHQIDVDWFGPYVETFPKAEVIEKKLQITQQAEQAKHGSSAITKGLRAALRAQDPTLFNDEETMDKHGKVKRKVKEKLFTDRKTIVRVWVALCDWFCAAAKFIRCMERRHEYKLFYNFLQSIGEQGMPNTVVDAANAMVSSNTDVTTGAAHAKPAKQIICGQLVTLKNLINDLDFWMETDAFKNLFIQKADDMNNSYEFYSEGLILQKADVIRACFLEQRGKENFLVDKQGSVVTDSHINVPRDLCDATIMSINSGIIDNTIFMEASGYVFPILVHFWKIYREQYAKISYNKWIGLTDMIKNRLKQERKRKTGFQKSQLLKKLHQKDGDTISVKEVAPPINDYQKLNKEELARGDLDQTKYFENGGIFIHDSWGGVRLPIAVSQIRNIKPLTPVPFNRYKRDLSARAANSATGNHQAGDYEAPTARITFSVQEGIVLHCTPRWQDAIIGGGNAVMKKVKQPAQSQIKIIKPVSNKEQVKEKSTKESQEKGGAFKIVIEDDESNVDVKKDKKKVDKIKETDKDKNNKDKSKKNKKNKTDKPDSKDSKTGVKSTKDTEKSGTTSSTTSILSLASMSDSKLTADQRCKRVLRKKDLEHDKMFALAEKRLRGAIRGQIREKRQVNAYPKYH